MRVLSIHPETTFISLRDYFHSHLRVLTLFIVSADERLFNDSFRNACRFGILCKPYVHRDMVAAVVPGVIGDKL